MEADLSAYRFGVITVSDSRTDATDESGPAVEDALAATGALMFERAIVADEIGGIQDAILDMCSRCDAIFTTGGTGFSAKDVTPDATSQVIERQADSLSERMRIDGLKSTPLSHLSRGVAGIRGHSLIVNLPGSPAGAREGIESLAPLLPHILRMMRGDTAHD